jgi:site-specific DNA-methyltransferase (adenine-specific)
MCKIDLIQGDCLEKMKDIPDKSVDMILCDLPYGITKCKWDNILPFELLWGVAQQVLLV